MCVPRIEARSRVLDLGCGLGGSCRHLASTCACHVTGVDLTEAYCEVATQLSGRVGLSEQTTFRQGNAHRVLEPGGRFACHDIFRGDGGDVNYPVPWADDASISHLWSTTRTGDPLEDVGWIESRWEDKSRESAGWFRETVDRIRRDGPPLLGIHLFMGSSALSKIDNLMRNLEEGRIVVAQAVLLKPA
ncbi:MAG: class I SAM-dependent methyltransferase [Planctomycetes bacterium]|nr:class I SAM-dependent methyltransferase [Planctomycetota bacterium]